MPSTDKKDEIVYAFIDSQNLNLGTSKNIYKNKHLIYKGWKLDFRKFRIYLEERLNVSKAFLFIGYVPHNKNLYEALESFGYILIFKPTLEFKKGRRIKLKGNVDAELVLHTMTEKDNYDKAVIVSGDGDFYCLYEFLTSINKLKTILIPNKKSESSLLKDFQEYKIYIWRKRDVLEKKVEGVAQYH
jgi:uncharacterized LabA/DUF88 family protein